MIDSVNQNIGYDEVYKWVSRNYHTKNIQRQKSIKHSIVINERYGRYLNYIKKERNIKKDKLTHRERWIYMKKSVSPKCSLTL